MKARTNSSGEAMTFDVRGLAQALGLSRGAIYKLDAEGRLPPELDLGLDRRLWSRAAVQAWIDSGCKNTTETAPARARADKK